VCVCVCVYGRERERERESARAPFVLSIDGGDILKTPCVCVRAPARAWVL